MRQHQARKQAPSFHTLRASHLHRTTAGTNTTTDLGTSNQPTTREKCSERTPDEARADPQPCRQARLTVSTKRLA
jgi:hypothetical protein